MLLRASTSGTALRSCCLAASRAHTSCRLLAPAALRASATAAGGGGGTDMADSSSPITAAQLAGQSCSLLGGCSSETPRIADEQLPALMAALPAWQLGPDSRSIHRRFVAKNFAAAIAFFNAVAGLAESEGHHPDLHLTGYRDVEVVLSTHAIGGLSMFDFVMAAKLDGLPVEASPKWLKAHQAALQAAAAAQAAAGPSGAAAAGPGASQ